MKKLIFTMAVASLALTSCSKEAPSDNLAESNVMLEEPAPGSEGGAAAEGGEATAQTDEQKGEKLLEGMDCLSCHKIDGKLVGPSYQEVAAKYTAADTDMLAQKIITGGAGHWGDVPMTPHAGLSTENATLMVKYILSLKK